MIYYRNRKFCMQRHPFNYIFIFITYYMSEVRLQNELGVIPTDKDNSFRDQLAQLGICVDNIKRADYQELYRILNVSLSFPDSSLAEKHRNANKLGEIDLKLENQKNMDETLIRIDMIKSAKICNCCGFFLQNDQISVCGTQMLKINNLGSSAIVFFKTFKNIAILLTVMVLIYSIFTFTTNVTTAYGNNYLNSSNGTLDYLSISLGSKTNSRGSNIGNANTYYLVSSWLGIPMLVVWLLLFIWMKKGIRKLQFEEKSYMSAADFSVVIEKMPTGLRKEQVQAMMDEYLKKIAPTDKQFKLKIEKYNEAKPFYFNQEEFNDEQLRKNHKKIKGIKKEIAEWIEERTNEDEFSSIIEYRQDRINELVNVRKKISMDYKKIVKKIIKKLEEKDKLTKTFVFITFETVEQRDFFLSYNCSTILSKIKNSLPCFDKSHRFTVNKNDKQVSNLIVESAPEPEDINWGNIGFGECESYWRRFATFLATIGMLGISFVIVYALSTVQNQNSSKRFVSILISLVISVINLIIIKVIQNMTVVQKIYTNNKFQMSLALKSIFAQLINSIFIPIVVNVYIKDNNLYNTSGLTEDIFVLAIANSFIPPIVRLIDPYYIFMEKRYLYYNRPLNKITLTQYELNFIAEKPEYELGLEYIYVISNFLFICFFVSLQPVIPLFGILGLFCMYWIEKYVMLHNCQRPVPGVDTISIVMYQMIYFGGISYALGSLTWSVFLKEQTFRNSLVANLIAAGLGLLIFIFPYETFVNYKQNKNCQNSYDDRRIFFTAEYDRLNPVTKKDGVKQYIQFLLKKKEEISKMQPHLRKEFAEQFLHLTQNNTYKGNLIKNNFFGDNDVSNALNQLFQNQTRNFFDPKILQSFLVGDHQHNLDLYINALEIRDFNSFNGLSEVIGRSMLATQKQLLQNQAKLGQNSTFAENNPDDIFKNIYKSMLNPIDLGITSRIGEIKINHRGP